METIFLITERGGTLSYLDAYDSLELAKQAIYREEFDFLLDVDLNKGISEDYLNLLKKLAEDNEVELNEITFEMFKTIAEEAWDSGFFWEDWYITEKILWRE